MIWGFANGDVLLFFSSIIVDEFVGVNSSNDYAVCSKCFANVINGTFVSMRNSQTM